MWKICGLIVLTLSIVIGTLFICGKFLISRLENETDRQIIESWGPGTSFVSTNSGETHVLDVGEGDVILLLHGSTGSIADWQESVAYELADSYRVVAFDSYGFGLSERNSDFDYGHERWVKQAVNVLDALEIEKVVVAGHSAGAMTAVLLATEYPKRFRGVILTGHGFSADPAQMLPFLPGVGELWAARQKVIGDVFSDNYRRKAVDVHRISGTRAAYLAFMRSQYYAETSIRLLDGGYEDIQVPVLQMHGTLDKSQTIQSARDLSLRLVDTRFAVFEGSDHFIHIEAPDRWIEEVTTFIEELH